DDAPATGVRLGAHMRRLPGRLRLDLRAAAATQRVDDETVWSARGRLLLDRSVALTPSLFLIPALAADLYHVNDASVLGFEPVDPRVLTGYARDHHRGAVARAALYWLPLQDQIGVLSLEARANADLASADYVAIRGAWRGMLELTPRHGPVLELGYRLSQRLADDHRSHRHLRHDPSLHIDWPLWRGPAGRLALVLD